MCVCAEINRYIKVLLPQAQIGSSLYLYIIYITSITSISVYVCVLHGLLLNFKLGTAALRFFRFPRIFTNQPNLDFNMPIEFCATSLQLSLSNFFLLPHKKKKLLALG